MSRPSDAVVKDQFASFYLQSAAKELAEDLDKVRGADDFKADSVPFLVHALQQGAMQFSAADQRRVVAGEDKAAGKS
jgi:ribosome assembly protein 3